MSLAGVACLSRLSCVGDANEPEGCEAFGGLWASSRDESSETLFTTISMYQMTYMNVYIEMYAQAVGRRRWCIGGRGLLPLKGGERVLLEWML